MLVPNFIAVLLKKDEKIQKVVSTLEANYSVEDFIEKFKLLYEKDWLKLKNLR